MRGLLIGVAILLVTAAPARAGDAVVMLSDSGDYIGGGIPRVYHPGNAQITVGGSTESLSIGVSGGGSGDSFHLEFAAPPGQSLAPGVYDRAQRASFREAGRPGIDIGGDGRGCNTITGRFEVRELAVSAEGVLQRLWIVYEQHCEGATAALYGEVRLGTGGAAAPGILRWPISDVGRGGGASPVTLIAPDGLTVTGASLAGDHPADFTIRADECSGRSLVPGGTCQVWVRYVPTTPGTRTALLRISDTAGRVHEAALQGFSYGGSTRLHMVSDEGDYIGAGQTWSYTPANDRISVSGSRRHVGFAIDGATGDWWYGDFTAAEGDILAPGRYAPASRYPFNGTGAGMDVSGNGRGCNQLSGEFTISEITFNEDGSLRTLGLDFEQHCEHATPALRGTIEWRKGDTTPPPPWTVSGPGSTAPITTLGSPGSAQPAPAPPAPQAPAPAAPVPAPGPCEAKRYARRVLVSGTSAADVLRGTARSERLLGGDGDDRVFGRDCLQGGAGRDRLSGGGSPDLLYGGDGDDLLSGGAGGDRLTGQAGADVLSGGSGADRLSGGGGADKLVGGPGADRLDCGAGRDVAFVTRGDRARGCERRTRARR